MREQRVRSRFLGRQYNNNNNNSIQFNWHLLTCKLNSTSAYYNARTKTQIKHKNSKNTQKQNTKQTQQKQILEKI
jgi:hypothetical protein